MKKIVLIAAVIASCGNLFAESASASAPAPKQQQQQKVMCTIVCSPCDGVENTLIEGEATREQIMAARAKMETACHQK